MRRLLLVALVALVMAGCSDDSATADGPTTTAAPSVVTSASTTVASTTARNPTSSTTSAATTTAAPTSSSPPPSTSISAPATAPQSTAPPSTAPPSTISTTTPPAPATMASASDLVGTLHVSPAEWVPEQPVTVTLTVTNASDRLVALEDRDQLRFLGVRAGDDVLNSSYLWLGDTALEPGEQHTMTRSWTPEFAPDPDRPATLVAVIAESVDSFNRAQTTVGVVEGVPALMLPVAPAA